MQANGQMTCDGHVTVHVTNDGTLTFHGQSATADSWIVKLDLAPGASQDLTALFTNRKSESGYVQGALDDGTRVSTAWSAVRDVACGAPTTTTTQPVDTTPHPALIGGNPVCIVPGSPTQEPVPCDSPRATTPDPTTTAVVAPEPSAAPTVAPAAPDTLASVQAHTGPPKTHTAHTVHTVPATLPVTGTSPTLGVLGGGALILGALLVRVTHRKATT